MSKALKIAINSVYGSLSSAKWGNGYDRNDTIKKIIFNQKACIVFWKDGMKTIVKRKENDKFDKYAAVAQAIAKHQYGSTSAFHKMVDSVSVSNVMTKLKD